MNSIDTCAPLALRPRDAAKMLGVSVRTLWTWTQAGLIPCVRVGDGKRKVVLYSVTELQGWLSRQSAPVNGGAL